MEECEECRECKGVGFILFVAFFVGSVVEFLEDGGLDPVFEFSQESGVLDVWDLCQEFFGGFRVGEVVEVEDDEGVVVGEAFF